VGAGAAVGDDPPGEGDGSSDGTGLGFDDGEGVIGGTVNEGDGVAEGVALGVGVGVGVGHPDELLKPLSLCEQSAMDPLTGVNALGLDRVLTNGTAMAEPVDVPNTWFMPCSAGLLPSVWPVHVATTQSGV
jgi:hypothetical protein